MTVEVVSLGCRLNLAESETLRAMLRAEANTVVINSCAVTAEAVRQTRQTIRRMRRAHPTSRLLVTGCAAEVERAALAAMPEVDGLIANATKLDPRAWNVAPVTALPATQHTRAFVAVQNGCDHSCTFCVIPQGRGPARSLPVSEVLSAVERHLLQGAREVVLTGVDLTSWGADLDDGVSLGALVTAVLDAFPQLQRLRLSSVDGAEVDPVLLDHFCHNPRVMPHLHLSLQHGDDLILKRMRRRHTRADAVRLVEAVRSARADVAIGADLIAGFPTEDERAHAANLAIIADLGIVHGHIFPYSARHGTPAARMPQVEPETIRARARQLRAAAAQQRRRWLSGLIGLPLSVLAERDGTGHAENFARVQLPPHSIPGTIMTITPRTIAEGLLA